MAKQFTVVGVSTLNGKTKLRFANGLALRTKVLERNGHSAIRLIELSEPVSKYSAAVGLKELADFADVRDIVDAFLAKQK